MKFPKAWSLFFIILAAAAALTFAGAFQVNKKITLFLQNKAALALEDLEREMGVQIQWKKLYFRSQTFSIHLKDVVLSPSSNAARKLSFIKGRQYVKKITLRPSLLFLFRRRIFFSKIELREGDFVLKTDPGFYKKSGSKKRVFRFPSLPFKRVIVRNTHLKLFYKGKEADFSRIHMRLRNRYGIYSFQAQSEKIFIEGLENPLSFEGAGHVSARRFVFQSLKLQGRGVLFNLKNFKGVFQKGRLVSFLLSGNGSFPLSSFYAFMDFFEKSPQVVFSGSLKTDFHIEKKLKKPLMGSFSLKSPQTHFKGMHFQNLHLQGGFRGQGVSSLQGGFQSEGQKFRLRSARWVWGAPRRPFQFSLAVERLSEDLLKKIWPQSPLRGKLSGALSCEGRFLPGFWECEADVRPSSLALSFQAGKNFISSHKVAWTAHFKSNGKNHSLILQGKKKNSTDLTVKLEKTEGKPVLYIEGYTRFPYDIRLPAVQLHGNAEIFQGEFKIMKEGLSGKAVLRSGAVTVEGWRVSKADALLLLSPKKLSFQNLKAGRGKSQFSGRMDFDFKNPSLEISLNSPFFYTEDLLFALEKNISFPLTVKGAGEGSFYMRKMFQRADMDEMRLKGNLFSVLLQEEFFSNVSFDILSRGRNGKIQNLHFKKNTGSLSVSGSFLPRLSVDIEGAGLALEQSKTLSSFFPFNLSGVLNFKMKGQGPLKRFQAKGSAVISEASLYTYPLKDSRLNILLNPEGLLLSGKLFKSVDLERLFLSFSLKKKPLQAKGSFKALDFVKVWMARNEKPAPSASLSNSKGSFDLSFSPRRRLQGVLHVEKFFMQRQEHTLKSLRPFSLVFRKGRSFFRSPLILERNGGDRLTIQPLSDSRLLIHGRLKIELLSFLFPALQRLKGSSDIYLKGGNNLSDLSLKGRIAVSQGGFVLDPLPSIQNIDAVLQVDGRKAAVQSFKGFSGRGRIQGKGFLSIEPLQLRLAFPFEGVTLNIPKGFSTTGSGEIQIQGLKPPYLISGAYTLEHGLITKELSGKNDMKKNLFSHLLEEKQRAREAPPFHMDIQVKSLNPVRIKNSFIQADILGGARIYGPASDLRLSGAFNIPLDKKGRISFRGREFKINEGRLSFENSPPENPYLSVTADTVFKDKIPNAAAGGGEEKREYHIFLKASGPAQNLDISLESVPHLKEKEIASMLAFGLSSRYFDKRIQESATQYSYQLLGSLLLQQPLSREARKRFGLEFDISNHFNKQNAPVSKITLKRRWGGKIETSVSRTLEEFPQSDVKLKYELSPRMALQAFWEERELTDLEDSLENNKTGLELEASLEF